MNNRATVVCCYNNPSLFEDMRDSLLHQTEEVEVIGIDNTEGRYKSCSSAFNSALPKINTEFVIFSHQDILLEDKDCIHHFLDYCSRIGKHDLLGVVGKIHGDKHCTGNVVNAMGGAAAAQKLEGIVECDSFDECFFGGRTCCFKRYPFSETLCPGWHLYAVERCVAAKSRGDKSYICDVNMIHLSFGKTNHSYNKTFYDISRFYADKVKPYHLHLRGRANQLPRKRTRVLAKGTVCHETRFQELLANLVKGTQDFPIIHQNHQ